MQLEKHRKRAVFFFFSPTKTERNCLLKCRCKRQPPLQVKGPGRAGDTARGSAPAHAAPEQPRVSGGREKSAADIAADITAVMSSLQRPLALPNAGELEPHANVLQQ